MTDAFEWDEEVAVRVVLRVKARPNPELFEGLQGRTLRDAAVTGVYQGGCDLERTDGWADLFGEVDIVDVEVE